MRLFGLGKTKIRLDEFVNQMFDSHSSTMQDEKNKAHQHNRQEWLKAESWDYNMEGHVAEHEQLYLFLTLLLIPRFYPELGEEFNSKFKQKLLANTFTIDNERFQKYRYVWEEAERTSVPSPGKAHFLDPINALAQIACEIRFPGNESKAYYNIIMMTASITGTVVGLQKVRNSISLKY